MTDAGAPGRDPRQDSDTPVTWAPRDVERALDALSVDWGDVYQFDIDAAGRWVGVRYDGLPAVTGDGPDELSTAILDDCAANPPRLP